MFKEERKCLESIFWKLVVSFCVCGAAASPYSRGAIGSLAAYATPATPQTEPNALLSEPELATVRASMILMRDQAAELMPFAFFSREQAQPADLRAMGKEAFGNLNQERKSYKETIDLLDKMNQNAQQLMRTNVFAHNPLAQVTLEMMARNLEESRANYKRGRVELSRDLLKASFHACLNCHASGLSQKQFSADYLLKKYDSQLAGKTPGDAASSPVQVGTQSSLAQAEMYFVLRDFTKAMEIINTGLMNAKKLPPGSLEAMELYLTAAVLVRTPPEKLTSTLEQWRKKAKGRQTMVAEIALWQRAIQDWAPKFTALEVGLKMPSPAILLPHANKGPGPQNRDERSASTEPQDALLAQLAQEIGLRPGETLLGKEKSLVDQLYAKLLLMQVVSETKNSLPRRARALHLLGLIYRANERVLFLGLGDAYFSACIDLVPHSVEAEACLGSLSASIEEASSGSLGTNIDDEDRAFLQKMASRARVQAQPIKSAPPPEKAH